MSQRRPVEKIHAAAHYFAFISRDIQDIADAFDVSTDTIRKWEKTPEWHKALDVFKYNGDRTFATEPKRDTAREKPEELKKARKIYLELYQELTAKGETLRKLPRLVEERTGIPRRSIADWARRYNWREEAQQ